MTQSKRRTSVAAFCSTCKNWKTLNHFYKNPYNKNGRDYRCKECKSIYEKERRLIKKIRATGRILDEHDKRKGLFEELDLSSMGGTNGNSQAKEEDRGD